MVVPSKERNSETKTNNVKQQYRTTQLKFPLEQTNQVPKDSNFLVHKSSFSKIGIFLVLRRKIQTMKSCRGQPKGKT